MEPTVMTAGWAKPATASVGVRTRLIISNTMIPMAVKSTGTFSVISKYRVMIKIVDTIQIVIVCLHSPAVKNLFFIGDSPCWALFRVCYGGYQ
jgi:hypothetical protein